MSFSYNFPRHKDVPRDFDGYVRQAEKMIEEATEALEEARHLARMHRIQKCGIRLPASTWNEVYSKLRRETLDAMHACETMLRAFSTDEVYEDAKWVEEHDRERGYYDATQGGE